MVGTWYRAHVVAQVGIAIDGPPGAGKTTLIARLLESNRARVITVARLVRDDALDNVIEDPKGNAETTLYKASGADSGVLYRVGPDGGELVPMLGAHPAEAVLVEGALEPVCRYDLVVHVTRPLPDDQSLLTRYKREVGRLDLRTYLDALGHAQRARSGEQEENEGALLATEFDPGADKEQPNGEEVPSEFDEEVVETIEISDEFARNLIEMAEHGVPIEANQWRLPKTHTGLTEARVAVINIESEAQRPAAERLAAEIRRLHEDLDVAHELQVQHKGRRAVSIFIVNLADKRDKELKKALARIKRTFQQLDDPGLYDDDW